MKLLQNKNIIITGARRGIGRAAVEAFAEHGLMVGHVSVNMTKPSKMICLRLNRKKKYGLCRFILK